MKPLIPLVATVLNVVWTATLLCRSGSSGAPVIAATPPVASPTIRAVSTYTPAATRLFHWSQVESTDYQTYMANLRAIGCPETTIRDIITADVHALYQAKRNGLRRQEPEMIGPAAFSAHDVPELARLDSEEHEVLEALGVQSASEASAAGPAAGAHLVLTARIESKRAALTTWEEESSAKREKLLESFVGREPSASELAELWQLNEDCDQRLDEILTPEEREEFELRNFPAAHALRESLSGIEVNEEEFRALYRAEKQFDVLFPGEDEDDNDPALAELDAEAERILGPERFALFKRGRQPAFQVLWQQAQDEGRDWAYTEAAWDQRQTLGAENLK